MSKIEVDAIEPQSGTSLTLGASGDTITIPSGATLTNSGTATGFGKVLQVVNGTTNVEVNTTTNTFVNTGLNASITPTSASNKVLILINQTGLRKVNADTYVRLKLQRVTTDITNIDFDGGYNNSSSVYNSFGGTGICYLDTPNTTSSTNYKTVFNSGANSGIVYVQVSGSVSSITLMEIEV
jgi:hypothetical protein